MKNLFTSHQKQEVLQSNLQSNLQRNLQSNSPCNSQSNPTNNSTENQKQDKLSDKAFSQSLTISIFSILLCIVLLCSLTFAWFNQDVSSPSNTLEAGQFLVDIVVVDSSSTAPVGSEKNGVWTYALETADTYTVTITVSEQATAKGYCEVSLNGGELLSTVHLIGENYKGNVTGERTKTIKFTVTHEDGENAGSLVIAPHWGISADSSIQNGTALPLPPAQP